MFYSNNIYLLYFFTNTLFKIFISVLKHYIIKLISRPVLPLISVPSHLIFQATDTLLLKCPYASEIL